jgi:hypothetical protein
METSFIIEKKIIALCFNPTKETIFLLYPDLSPNSYNTTNLLLTEEDLYRNIIIKRFKLLENHECNIINTNYRQLPKDTYEGYSIYFWELTEKLFVVYPFGYILIYDYTTSQLITHFQCHGQKAYVIRNIVGSPMDNSFFISAENMHNIYHIDYSCLINDEKKNSVYTKIVLPKDSKVYDIVAHPNEKFIFAGCADGTIRVYDYVDSKNIKELPNGIIDSDHINNNKSGNHSIICLDINSTGSFLLAGTEDGFLYLWDAFSAIKDKRILLNKTELPSDSIFSVKFLRSKQFEGLKRFVCLTKKGKIYIYFIRPKVEDIDITVSTLPKKELCLNLVYENSTFDPIIYSLHRYNTITSTFLNISYSNNAISVTWPNFKLEKMKINGKLENYLLFPYFTSKIFFFYNNVFPKINYPLSTQLKYRNYESYIPSKNQPNFENKLYYADNYFIYLYEISSGTSRKIINYSKEAGIKNIYLLKFDLKGMTTNVIFFILLENDLNRVVLIMIDYDVDNNAVLNVKKFNKVNDFVILGNNNDFNVNNDYVYMLGKDMQNGFLYQISTKKTTKIEIESSALRIYHTPFNDGYCIFYRNLLNELKYSNNFKKIDKNKILPQNNNINITLDMSSLKDNPYEDSIVSTAQNVNSNNTIEINEEKLQLKCSTKNAIKLEFNEREIDIIFNTYNNSMNPKYFCAISMIDKINFFDIDMKFISSVKLQLKENPFLISSLFFLDSTLIYSKGNVLYYYYPKDNINQKIFSNSRTPTIVSGILSDRFILVSQGTNNNIITSELTTPLINPLEPILMGYLDDANINYNLVRECVVNMFTNQISKNLVKKLMKKNLEEVAWLLISDIKSCFQNIDIKIKILNDMYDFDKVIENIIVNKDLNSDLNLDEIIWRLNYDQSINYIKNILIKEIQILIKFGQFSTAIKILELLGDYPKVLNLLLLSSSNEEYEKLRINFQTKKCLNFTDNLFINNAFTFMKQPDLLNPNRMKEYKKIFDKYEGEHFIFGANQNKLNIKSIEDIKNKMPKGNSKIPNIQKKIINYGETAFSLYSDVYNSSTKKNDTIEICSLVLQKIENYYGIKNTVKKMGEQNKKKVGFQDYNVPLEHISPYNNNMNNNFNDTTNTDINDVTNANERECTNDPFDLDSNCNIEDISENLYLSAYYHCDKGSGVVVEDITDNNNKGKIDYVSPPTSNNNINENFNINNQNEENIFIPDLWSDVLEEFEPLEYEDKWGRKSPGAHSIKFSKEIQTKLIIPNSPSLSHLAEKFSIELWLKLTGDNVSLLKKDSFCIDIYNGQFKLFFNGKEINSEQIKEYKLPLKEYMHIAILYKKKLNLIQILLNCEEILKFSIKLNGLNINTDLIFGNGNLDGELTEIKIWNQKMPIAYIKDNYKAPLPILAENKRKLKMKISKQDKTSGKKKFGFGNNPFTFGNKEAANNNQNNNINNNEEQTNTPINPFFNNEENNMNNANNENSINYPNFSTVVGERESFNFGFNENTINPDDNKNNEFNFNDDFNFD